MASRPSFDAQWQITRSDDEDEDSVSTASRPSDDLYSPISPVSGSPNPGDNRDEEQIEVRLRMLGHLAAILADMPSEQERISENLRRLMTDYGLSVDELIGHLTDDAVLARDPTPPIIRGECQIHLDEAVLDPPSCCHYSVCRDCTKTYVRTLVSERNIKIHCLNPTCESFMARDEIRRHLDENLTTKFDQFLVDANRDPHRKTCPRCSEITTETRPPHKSGLLVTCSVCQLVWCFTCQAPWHTNITCKEYLKGDKLVKKWANQYDSRQVNARQCPKCKTYIQRSSGCDHMECSQCNTKFCYLCGNRRKVPKILWPLLGGHDSRLGAAGCTGNFLPHSPTKRRLARGAVLGAKVAAAPVIVGVAAAAVPLAVGLVAAAIPIAIVGVPLYYGIYRFRMRKRKTRASNNSLSVSDEAFEAEVARQLGLMDRMDAVGDTESAADEDDDLQQQLELIRQMEEREAAAEEEEELRQQLELIRQMEEREAVEELRQLELFRQMEESERVEQLAAEAAAVSLPSTIRL